MDQKYVKDDQGRVYQNCKFHEPRFRGSCVLVYKYNISLILFSLIPGIDQTKWVYNSADHSLGHTSCFNPDSNAWSILLKKFTLQNGAYPEFDKVHIKWLVNLVFPVISLRDTRCPLVHSLAERKKWDK